MSELKTSFMHSPGPWSEIEGRRVIFSSSGAVCEVFAANLSTLEAEGNKALILAAPQLLAAAKRALAVLKAQGNAVTDSNVLGALDAAIKKATP